MDEKKVVVELTENELFLLRDIVTRVEEVIAPAQQGTIRFEVKLQLRIPDQMRVRSLIRSLSRATPSEDLKTRYDKVFLIAKIGEILAKRKMNREERH